MRRAHNLLMATGVSVAIVAFGAAALALDGQEEAPAVEEIIVDSDGDGLSDDDELNIYFTDPLDDDSDDDGLLDGVESTIYGTNPLRRDTDGDGLDDGEELLHSLDPLDPNDCPQELCPRRSSLLKTISVIRRQGET